MAGAGVRAQPLPRGGQAQRPEPDSVSLGQPPAPFTSDNPHNSQRTGLAVNPVKKRHKDGAVSTLGRLRRSRWPRGNRAGEGLWREPGRSERRAGTGVRIRALPQPRVTPGRCLNVSVLHPLYLHSRAGESCPDFFLSPDVMRVRRGSDCGCPALPGNTTRAATRRRPGIPALLPRCHHELTEDTQAAPRSAPCQRPDHSLPCPTPIPVHSVHHRPWN